MTIPVTDPARWFRLHAAEVATTQSRVLDSGRFILGPEVEQFEQEFAAFCATKEAVAVGSGTDALTLVLHALGVAGGEVVTSAHNAVATLAAIERAGAQPVLADIDADTFCLSPASVQALLGPDTRAIVAVHMHGHPADMDALGRLAAAHNIPLVEDASQAHGARIDGSPVGGFSVAAAFSFYPTKTIGAMGDAGAVVTGDAALAGTLRRLRQYGWDDERVCRQSGFNSRMDDLQAALLRLRLDYFDTDFARRQAIAARYTQALAGLPGVKAPRVARGCVHGFHHFILRSDARDALARHLADHDIGTARYYEQPAHAHSAYRGLRRDSLLGVTEKLYATMLAIPASPELTDAEVDRVCDALAAWGRQRGMPRE